MKSTHSAQLAFLATTTLAAACSPIPAVDDAGSDPQVSSNTTNSASPRPYAVPENRIHSTIVWSAEPEIDLFGTEGTLARAGIEANAIALASAVTDSYPGFERVIDEETKAQYLEIPPTNNLEVGTAYFHIMRIEPTPTGFIAHTCRQMSNVAVKKPDGHYSRSVTTGDFNPKFAFERTGTPQSPSPQPAELIAPTATAPVDDTGQPQWQAPTYDVFTGWTIDIDGWSGQAHTDACRHWGHQYAPDAIPDDYFILTTDTPPDTLPAYPGW